MVKYQKKTSDGSEKDWCDYSFGTGTGKAVDAIKMLLTDAGYSEVTLVGYGGIIASYRKKPEPRVEVVYESRWVNRNASSVSQLPWANCPEGEMRSDVKSVLDSYGDATIGQVEWRRRVIYS